MLLALIQLVGRSWAMTLGVLPSLSAVLMDLRPLVSTVAVRAAVVGCMARQRLHYPVQAH